MVPSEPTTVPVKLSWIEAMMKLAPGQAEPLLKRWSGSPHVALAQEARKALEKIQARTIPSVE